MGPQVEPEAALWLDDVTHIRVPSLNSVTSFSEPGKGDEAPDDRLALNFASDFPFSDPDKPDDTKLRAQLDVLIDLADRRDIAPYPRKVGNFGLTPLSRFLHLRPVPFGAIFDTVERPQNSIENVLEQHQRILDARRTVNEGRELARMFENETPGLLHRHAGNWLLFNRADISPPRQARMWMALDVTIYAALSAAWYYKWLRPTYSRLIRPREFELRVLGTDRLTVLYDQVVQFNGQDPDDPDLDRECPQPTPGTPRHPAWPSGHSTYSAAASHILEYFFSPDTLHLSDKDVFDAYPADSDDFTEPGWIAAELRRLANNIGEARLWGGVHWIDDHVAGQKIGRSAATAVIRQLQADCTPVLPSPVRPCNSTDSVPTDDVIEDRANRSGDCGADDHDFIPQRPSRGASFRKRFGVS
jgi:membrane-associated phospholipid phosphatase